MTFLLNAQADISPERRHEIYESPVLATGVYQKTPDKTAWTAPRYVDVPKNLEAHAHYGGRTYLPWAETWPAEQITHIDSSTDWYLTLQYGHPSLPKSGHPIFNTPLPCHLSSATGGGPGIPMPCDFENISWAYANENCFENTLTRVKFAIVKSYEFYENVGINQQP